MAGCVGVYGFQVWAAKFAEEEEEEAMAAVMKMVRTTERAEVEMEMVVQKVCGPHVVKILVGQSFEVAFKLEVPSYIYITVSVPPLVIPTLLGLLNRLLCRPHSRKSTRCPI